MGVRSYTDADLDRLSWHDCTIWRIDLQVGDADDEDWTSDLVIGLDFIAEWLCGVDESVQFKVAPARLTFHGVTDPKIGLHWEATGFQTAISLPQIDQITRQRVTEQKVYLDRPYYRWRIGFNWPAGAEITFGAVGFTQVLLVDPLVRDTQGFTRRERDRLIGPPPTSSV